MQQVSKISIAVNPFRLTSPLSKILEQMHTALFQCTQHEGINDNYIYLIKEFYRKGQDLSLLLNITPTGGNSFRKFELRHIAIRVALANLWVEFVVKCLEYTSQVSENQAIKCKRCPPIGFLGNVYYCKSPLCPHCFLRKAGRLHRQLKKLNYSDSTEAMVLSIETPFDDKIVYFESDAPNSKLVSNITTIIGSENIALGIYTKGVTLRKQIPHQCSSIAIVPKAGSLIYVAQGLSYLASTLKASNNHMILNLTYSTGINDICCKLCAAPPTLLMGVASSFSDPILQTTTEKYLNSTLDQKGCIFFGNKAGNKIDKVH